MACRPLYAAYADDCLYPQLAGGAYIGRCFGRHSVFGMCNRDQQLSAAVGGRKTRKRQLRFCRLSDHFCCDLRTVPNGTEVSGDLWWSDAGMAD